MGENSKAVRMQWMGENPRAMRMQWAGENPRAARTRWMVDKPTAVCTQRTSVNPMAMRIQRMADKLMAIYIQRMGGVLRAEIAFSHLQDSTRSRGRIEYARTGDDQARSTSENMYRRLSKEAVMKDSLHKRWERECS